MAEVSAAFRALYASDLKELKDLAQLAKDLPTTKPLTEKQFAARTTLEAKAAEIGPVVKKALEEKHAQIIKAQEEQSAAAAERAATQSHVEKAREDVKTASEALNAAKSEASKAAEVRSKSTLTAVQRYSKFVQERSAFQADLKWRTWLLTTIGTLDDAALRTVDLTDAFALTDEWEKTQQQLDQRIEALQKEGQQLRDLGAKHSDLSDLHKSWETLKEAKATQEGRLQKERARRDEQDRNIAAFVKEQGKLLQWCRQQKGQLEHLTNTEHVQEFCASLQSNNATMEANFVVLSDMAESLLPNETVQKALMEVSEAWFTLQVYTYERLRQCLMEQHQRSMLEDELRGWGEYARPLREYLVEVEKLLSQPMDDEATAYIQPMLESCKSLTNEYTPHQLIADHLSDFSLRMQCLQDNYATLRRSIFSPLSILCQALTVGTTSWKRKEEYNAKLGELIEWVDVKGQSDTWKDLLARIDKIKQLIEENEAMQGLEDTLRH